MQEEIINRVIYYILYGPRELEPVCYFKYLTLEASMPKLP